MADEKFEDMSGDPLEDDVYRDVKRNMFVIVRKRDPGYSITYLCTKGSKPLTPEHAKDLLRIGIQYYLNEMRDRSNFVRNQLCPVKPRPGRSLHVLCGMQ